MSGPSVVALANNKLATAAHLAAVGVPTPQSLLLADYLREPDRLRSPVIAKPLAGSASVGIVWPKNNFDLAGLDPEQFLIQGLWRGREFTVNMFVDQSGRLRSIVPHERLEVRSGEVSKGVTRAVPALADAAEKLAVALPGAVGPL